MRRTGWYAAVAAAMVLALFVAACGGDESDTGGGGALSGDVRVDGSSTVGPLTEAAAEFFQAENPDVRVTVGISGTGGGFEKFAAGETDISDASRQIEDDEIQALADAGIEWAEVQVASDGLAVVVNPENTWADSLTVEQLNKIWNEGSTIANWNEIDPSFPDVPLELFGAGTDSGTFDYFTTDYLATEDDNVSVQGVAGSKGGMAYFGLSYYEQNTDKLKLLAIDAGDGPVTPTRETVQSGEYRPLSRPLFIYVKKSSLARPEVAAFVQFYLDNVDRIAEQALFVPLTAQQKTASQASVDEMQASPSPSI
jgi:phosphate transport system substrate-binding protein